MVSCTQAQLELPLVTHFSEATCAFQEGAIGSYPTGCTDVAGQDYHGLLPTVDSYVAENYSTSKRSDSKLTTWTSDLCAKTHVAVEIRKPASYSDWSVARQAAQPSRGSIQILPALISGRNLVTVVLPPGWTPTAAPGTYPVLFNGFYDIHEATFDSGQILFEVMAQTWNQSKAPFIGLFWNGGGAIASGTMNPRALPDFNTIIQAVKQNFGADPNRIVSFGGSRGGITALRIASNPNGYPYTVRAAYAANPPCALGQIGQITGSTIPGLIQHVEWTLGLQNTWSSAWVYPDVGNGMAGLTRDQAHLQVLSGTSDPVTADQTISISSPKLLNSLKTQGTQVFLEIGSHDSLVPWVDKFRYSRLLDQYGIPHQTQITYLAGHNAVADLKTFLVNAMTLISTQTSPDFVTNGQTQYFQVNSSGGLDSVSGPRFTIEIPRYVSPNVHGHLIATGIPGTLFELTGTSDSGTAVKLSSVLGADGTYVLDLAASYPAAGVYTFTALRIQKPDSAIWQNVPFDHTTTQWNPGGLVGEALASDYPATAASQVAGLIMQGYLGPLTGTDDTTRQYCNGTYCTVSYGVSE